MADQVEIRRIAEERLGLAGDALGRAFYDDPLMSWVIADDEVRRREIGWFMGVGARYGHRFGHVHDATIAAEQGGDAKAIVAGAAVWLPPGETELLPERLAQVGANEGPRRLGESSWARFEQFAAHAAPLHAKHMPERHWYLMILGVDPPLQGRGIGADLLRPGLSLADRDGLPCYLETQKPANVPFYRRAGFEVVDETDITDAGPHLWLMARPPRAA